MSGAGGAGRQVAAKFGIGRPYRAAGATIGKPRRKVRQVR